MDTVLMKKYEAYISELKAANEDQKKFIAIQEQEIDSLKKLLVQKDEKIEILTEELRQTIDTAKEMEKILNSIFQD
ncbi:MAG: hypothetical protein ACI4ES_01525 [Roseburia sp.]